MEKRSVFVIGDSVSIHYGPYLNKLLENKFFYDRKRGIDQALKNLDKPIGANAGDSRMVLQYLEAEHIKNIRYDILIINCGLHDIRRDRDSNNIQVELNEYKSNLRNITNLCKVMANKVIWVGLTPVVDKIHNSREGGFLRYNKDVIDYDTAAKLIMSEKSIPYIDMYNFCEVLGENIYCDHVHFKEEYRKLQAAFISGFLNGAIYDQ